jgi:hypothetical protein
VNAVESHALHTYLTVERNFFAIPVAQSRMP